MSTLVIIGGGMAGMSCAYHLIKNKDFKGNVIIVEAKGSVGGRIKSIKLSGENIELGANWIHGIINNPLYNFATRYELIDPISTQGQSIQDASNLMAKTSSGESIPYAVIESVYNVYFWTLKKSQNFYHSMKKGEDIPEISNLSLGEYLSNEFDAYLLTRNEEERFLEKALFDSLLSRENAITGSETMNKVSLKYFGAYEELPGGNVVIPGGYIQLIHALLIEMNLKLKQENSEKRLKILLNHPVELIEWPGIGNKKDKPVKPRVYCSNGQVIECDHVVVTLPLGVLKSAKNLFNPPLPQYKQDAISRMGFGTVDKIFLTYDTLLTQIPKNVDEILTVWLPNDNLLPSNWYKGIFSFSKVSDRILVTWISGPEALEAEKMNEEQLSRDITILLRKLFNCPNFPYPVSSLKTTWGSDKYFCGSYSYIPIGSTPLDIDLISQPIYSHPGEEKPVLVFAGEACHPTFFSTVHGALLSGKKAAYYLIDTQPLSDDSNDPINKSNL